MPTLEEQAIERARAASLGAWCWDRQIGVVIVDVLGNIIADGNNECCSEDSPYGTPLPECLRIGGLRNSSWKCGNIHAEVIAPLKARVNRSEVTKEELAEITRYNLEHDGLANYLRKFTPEDLERFRGAKAYIVGVAYCCPVCLEIYERLGIQVIRIIADEITVLIQDNELEIVTSLGSMKIYYATEELANGLDVSPKTLARVLRTTDIGWPVITTDSPSWTALREGQLRGHNLPLYREQDWPVEFVHLAVRKPSAFLPTSSM